MVELICMRLDEMEMIHPLMIRDRRCSKCQHAVGIYPSGQKIMRERKVEIVCNHCYKPARVALVPKEAIHEMNESIPAPGNN